MVNSQEFDKFSLKIKLTHILEFKFQMSEIYRYISTLWELEVISTFSPTF